MTNNDDRVLRHGAHLLATARSLGWNDDGEGALEFLMRRTREVALEDCADEIERLNKRIEELLDANGYTALALAKAEDEIERLKARIADLEEQLLRALGERR